MSIAIDRTQISPKMSAVLRWEEAGERRALFLSKGDIAQIGREEDNEVCIKDNSISRHHATVASRDDSFVVTDLGSTNGTKLNGEQVTQPSVLKDNDIIRLDEKALIFHEIHFAEPDIANTHKSDETFIVRQDAAQPRFIVTAGTHEGKEFLLYIGKIVIGRATSKTTYDISLQDKAISRPQVEIENKENRFSITDLKSVNGTLVNGELIIETTEMQDGDVIEIGETTMLFRAR